MTRMTASEAFVETLVAHGVTDVFGIVGSAFMDALDPDEELDIRDAGLHAYGPDVHQTSFLAEMSGLAIAEPVGDDLTVVLGTRMIARETMGWLPTVR